MVYNSRLGRGLRPRPREPTFTQANTVEYVDPAAITASQWEIFSLLTYCLAGIAICNFTLAVMFLFGNVVIPSMQATGHMKASASAFRPVFFLLGLVALAGTIYCVLTFVHNLSVVYAVYPHKIQ